MGIGVVCVLTDACAALNATMDILQKFSGPLAPLQWREVGGRAAPAYLRAGKWLDRSADLHCITRSTWRALPLSFTACTEDFLRT
jgi:hypothetical protein